MNCSPWSIFCLFMSVSHPLDWELLLLLSPQHLPPCLPMLRKCVFEWMNPWWALYSTISISGDFCSEGTGLTSATLKRSRAYWHFLYLILLLLVCQIHFGSSCVEEMMNKVLGVGNCGQRLDEGIGSGKPTSGTYLSAFEVWSLVFLWDKQLLWWILFIWEREAPICWLWTFGPEQHEALTYINLNFMATPWDGDFFFVFCLQKRQLRTRETELTCSRP